MARVKFATGEQKRGDCYRLFSGCFYPPDRQMLLDERVVENLHNMLESVCPDAAPHAAAMAQALLRAEDEELAVAHAKLFVGPFELEAPPYGSVYLGPQRRLMGDSTVEVVEMYERAGLSLSENFMDAPDHISAELEFMYFLIAKEHQALLKEDREEAHKYLKMKQEFSTNYLRTWVEPFCERIKKASEHEFYTSLANCLSAFIMKTPVPETLPVDLNREA
jgi:TorA maturation chaperone TorD